MQNLKPRDYGGTESMNPNSEDMRYTWKQAVRQIQKIAEHQTPRTKLMQIGRAIEIIQHAFDLIKGEMVCADDLVAILPYLFVQANVDRLFAHFNFVCAFHISEGHGD